MGGPTSEPIAQNVNMNPSLAPSSLGSLVSKTVAGHSKVKKAPMKNPNTTVIAAVPARSFNPSMAKTDAAVAIADPAIIFSTPIDLTKSRGRSPPIMHIEFMIV